MCNIISIYTCSCGRRIMNGEDPLNGMCEYCWKQMADELEHEMRYEANLSVIHLFVITLHH